MILSFPKVNFAAMQSRIKLYHIPLVLILLNSYLLSDNDPKQKKIYFSLETVKMKVQDIKSDEVFYTTLTSKENPAYIWERILKQMRNGLINREQTIDSLDRFCNTMNAYITENKIKTFTDMEWVFPLRGYTSGAIGGFNGSGFDPYGFSFYDMNSPGHPAQDIFIYDTDQNCLDDITNNPVEILSVSSGIVVETRTGWTPDIDTRGGNIVYVYDNFSNGFFYYAHMKDVLVSVGELVEPGSILGTMGRTGKNAFPKRSPTHLHIMYVRSYNGNLLPENIYGVLVDCRYLK